MGDQYDDWPDNPVDRMVNGTIRVRETKIIPTEEFDADPTKPAHYTQYAIQPITFIMENDLPFWMANVIKYVMRADRKAGVEDLRKAIRCIEMRINQLEGKDVTS